MIIKCQKLMEAIKEPHKNTRAHRLLA